ncbi:pyruvate formate-lyase-activating protein [Ligilactobacillus animalis]|uniref:pyruvate formate-lyase-activating protein n=1 Tax=Ligilactobacillus animalis TaxID=1605 RepID=UPI0008247903|nr:pyruvate formate-lyase-activating protein [Ligilactobacillus animalis]MDO5884096.1 pyruvate formate-lyase-activating protein [Ligilactobacillus animalis]MDQ2233384.1 pyruvate formate-lyase-activating protein [Ligilactobacillus animalis]MDU1487272.1 pyruvate formate-lyase-activating protein [Ligilactobacillus animalis]MDU3187017.1 pyruvate formate-lyase-activating protein [Ligilactobacillus animalis]MDU8986512.1 pyruvate formate-lyase-activating protein [Ligilactobacillus animalis]
MKANPYINPVPTKDGQVLGYVHSLETFGAVDGPGIRFVAFMQGCNMRCKFCHNPDTWKKNVGTQMTASELLEKALPYRAFWGEDGGITLSGGEILLQPEFALEVFKKCKEPGISTCLDTCGAPFTRREPWFSLFNELLEYTDILLVDIKHINSDEHKLLTGYPNENILDMCKYLSELGKPVWIRHVLVPGITDNDKYLKELGEYIKTLKNVEKVEVLPYHTMGVRKYKEMGIKYRLEGVEPPTADRIENAEKLLCVDDYKGYLTWKPGINTKEQGL